MSIEEFVKDLAEYGTRFDLNPTVFLGDKRCSPVHREYLAYIKRIDQSIRERAQAIMDDLQNGSNDPQNGSEE